LVSQRATHGPDLGNTPPSVRHAGECGSNATTATSAVCVTGLTVTDTATYWSAFGQVVILVCIQAGGLGFRPWR